MRFETSASATNGSSSLQFVADNDVLETIYAPNAVDHMMSGKAVSRAVRGHLLVDAALCAMVTAEIYGTTPQQMATCERTDTDQADLIQTANPQNEPPPDVPFETDEHRVQENELDVGIRNDDANDLDTISAIYDQLLRKQISPESVLTHPVIEKKTARAKAKTINGINSVQIHTLPPTSAAAKFHSLRAHLQAREWTQTSDLEPTMWGWRLDNGLYVPVKTDMPPAPANLLAIKERERENRQSETDRQAGRQVGKQAGRQTDIQTDLQTDIQTNIQTYIQTDIQTERHIRQDQSDMF
ncbi:hypothetical protein DPMN_171531 [Dreissena polymorpha]|uniref:Uncharacterized protein n=1 Tax=Dreissena polymorpha TaxID=45954 RepID=A0A9D4DY64_DREPO|nr:hypothetical protein DPMN_171531 [Dreissena polymorpha]